MKLVFYSVVINHHQAPVADEFYKLLGNEYCFVELINLGDTKGATDDYSKRPYLLRAWESPDAHAKVMELARTAECCIFSGVQSLPFMKERLKLGLLTFDMGERWLKQGLKNVLSPAISKMALAYYMNGWKHKPLYKLCMSAFAAGDHARLGMYKGKCFKWGYFTKVVPFDIDEKLEEKPEVIKIMWCARFLKLKHPELPVLMASHLKREGYSFVLDFYGAGEQLEPTKQLAESLDLSDWVKFHGTVSNDQVLEAMRQHDIFLFTSNRLEGWGAVVNEALSSGCAVVGNDVIGSVPYLLTEKDTGCQYHETVTSLTAKVSWLLSSPKDLQDIARRGYKQMVELWNPYNAAVTLLQLIEDIKSGRGSSIKSGPCSKA